MWRWMKKNRWLALGLVAVMLFTLLPTNLNWADVAIGEPERASSETRPTEDEKSEEATTEAVTTEVTTEMTATESVSTEAEQITEAITEDNSAVNTQAAIDADNQNGTEQAATEDKSTEKVTETSKKSGEKSTAIKSSNNKKAKSIGNTEPAGASKQVDMDVTGVTVTVNGEELKDGTEVENGSQVNIEVHFKTDNDNVDKSENTEYVLDLTKNHGIKLNDVQDQPMTDPKGNVVGTYSIKDGKLIVKVTDPDMLSSSDMTGTVKLNGVVNFSNDEIDDGTDDYVQFATKRWKVDVKKKDPDKSSLYVQKGTVGNRTLTADGKIRQQFSITITSNGENSEINLNDVADENLKLSGDVIVTPAKPKGKVTITKLDNSFKCNISEMEDGETITLTYTMEVDASDVNASNNYFKNKAEYTYKDNKEDTPSGSSYDVGLWVNTPSVNKYGTYNAETHTVNWTITFNGNDMGIDGAKFTDKLGEHITAAADAKVNVTISTYDPKTDQWGSETTQVSFSALQSGGWTIPTRSDGKIVKSVTMTYSTSVNTDYTADFTEDKTVDNTVTVNLHDAEYKQTGTATIGKTVLLNKVSEGANEGVTTLKWKSTITVPVGGLNNLKYKDTIKAGHKLKAGTVTVTGITGTTVTPTTGADGQSFEIDFGNVANNTGKPFDITITYQTECTNTEDRGLSYTYENDAKIEVDSTITQEDNASYPYTAKNILTKSGWTSGYGTVWQLAIDLSKLESNNFKDLIITDTLPEHMFYKEGSLKFGDLNNVNMVPDNSWKIVSQGTKLTITIPKSALQNVWKAITEKNQWDKQLYIVYTTFADFEYANSFPYGGNVTNKAEVKEAGSDEVIGSGTANQWVSPPDTELVTKTGEYAAPNIEYTIDINKYGMDIVPGSDELRVVDVMGSALLLHPDTLVIKDDDGVLDKSEYRVTYESDITVDGKKKNRLTIVVPDERHLIITYNVLVDLPKGASLDVEEAENQVTLEGVSYDKSQASSKLSGYVSDSSGELTSDKGRIRLWKYDKTNLVDTLASARFRVWLMRPDGKGGYVEAKEGEVTGYEGEAYIDSSGTGYTSVNRLLYDNVYAIQEVSAPIGYMVDNTLYWFVLMGADKKTLPDKTVMDKYNAKPLEIEGDVVYFPNERVEGGFNIGKKDEDGNYLPGATLKLYQTGAASNSGITIETSGSATTIKVVESNPDLTKNEIVAGSYTLEEIDAPDGYQKAAKITFDVDKNGKVTNVQGGQLKNGELVMVDKVEEAASVSIYKRKNTLNGDLLSGAKLTLTGDGKTYNIDTTKTNPAKFTGLKRNTTYTLREITPPTGYNPAADIVFSIDADGKVTGTGDNKLYLDSSNGTNTVTMIDVHENTKMYISKKDITGSKELSGAELEVYKKGDAKPLMSWASNGTLHEITVSLDGSSASSSALAHGKYVLVEKTSPDGYAYSEDIEFTITDDGEVLIGSAVAENNTVVMKDAPLSIHIDKRDMSTGSWIGGAHFTLKDDKGNTIDTWISDLAEHVISAPAKKLKVGVTYTLTETQAPSETNGRKYEKMQDVKFTIEKDGSLKIIDKDRLGEDVYLNSDNHIILYNIPVSPGNFYISKRDTAETLDKEIEKVGFTLTDLTDSTKTPIQWTTGSTPTTFWVFSDQTAADGFKAPANTYELLTGHKYSLEETQAAFGYEKVTGSWTFTVQLNEEGERGYVSFEDVVAPASETDSIKTIERKTTAGSSTYTSYDIRILNRSKDLSISKQSIAGAEVPGATLRIYKYDASGKVVKEIEWESKDKPHQIPLSELGFGKFKLEEIAAPKGYAYAESIDFNIDEEGNVSLSGDNGDVDGSTIIMTDEFIKNFSVSKKAVSEEDELPGASITLYEVDSDGKETVVESWTSGTDPHEIVGTKLKAGVTYKLHENAAPAGYQVTTDIMFEIGKDGTIKESSANKNKEATISAEDEEIVIRDKAIDNIYVSKKTIFGAEELPGAEITLYEIDDKGNETIIDSWTSETTPHEIDGTDLKVGYKYKLHEEAAPDGYQVTTDIIFEIAPDGSIQMSSSNTNEDAEINADGRQIVIRDRADAEEEEKEKEEEEKKEDEETGTKTATKTDSKKTGDSAPIPFAGTLFFLSLAGAGTAYGLRRKKARRK